MSLSIACYAESPHSGSRNARRPDALAWAAVLAYYERNPAEVDSLASEIIELSTRYNIFYFLTVGAIYRGWARSALQFGHFQRFITARMLIY